MVLNPKYDEKQDHPNVYNAHNLGDLADIKERNNLQDFHQDDDDSDADTGYSEKS